MAGVGALSEDMFNANKYCVNCYVFNWKQPSMDLLKRCTGCRLVWYCSVMCQKEHWFNTHKNQCKYLSNKKVLRKAKHEETTCLVCKEEASVGKEEMSKQSNPNLPCTMSRANKELMNIDESFYEGVPYLALAEMTGMFHTKVEAIIVTFMRILVKMKMTKHSLWQVSRTAVLAEDLYKTLWKERIICLCVAITLKKSGPLEGQLLFEEVDSRIDKDIDQKMVTIGGIRLGLELMGFIAGEEFPSLLKPWKTLEVLTALLGGGNMYIARYVAECEGIVDVPEEIRKIRTTSAQFNKMRDNILKMLSGGLVPYTSLVTDGLCDGNIVQQCIVCREGVTVKRAEVGVSPVLPGNGEPVIVLGQQVTFYKCGRDSCNEGIENGLLEGRLSELRELYITLIGEHLQELCDYCGKLNHKARGLKCAGCLTKLYCGVECQVKDIYHLQKKCERGEKRKKKRSDGTRKKEGVQFMRERNL